MIAADRPVQRPADAKLLVIDQTGHLRHAARHALIDFLRAGDVVVANDAATLPASLHGTHVRTGGSIELRLAGRRSLASDDLLFTAVVFGAGDYHVRTEDRVLPPALAPEDRLQVGPLSATIVAILGHPRLASVRFDGSVDAVWAGFAQHGRPIQYAHIAEPLALWDVWTVVAGVPAAFEPPSAGFALDWRMLADLRRMGVEFATLTHAAGISSTGDEALDRQLPLDEPYEIPAGTAQAIAHARARGGRVVALGTTVVRALEHAAARDGVVGPGRDVATNRITAATSLRVVDALISGVHEPRTSHYELIRAFADDGTLGRANEEMTARGYRIHEFGDSVMIERALRR